MRANACTLPAINQATSLPLILALLLGGATATDGATRTWDGSYSTYWSAPQNWVEGVPPVAGDDLVFPSGATNKSNVNNVGNRTFRSITISGTGYTLSGSGGGATIGLTHGIVANTAGASNSIELNIDLMASQQFECNVSTGKLYVNGDVDLGSDTLTTWGAGQVHLAGVVSGAGGITKNGSGTHWLEGSTENTYTGPTLVHSGTLLLAKTVGNAVQFGSLTIGDDLGSADTVIVREQGNYQIANIPVTINTDGWLDVNDYHDAVGAITFNGGHAGSWATGQLLLAGSVTVNAASQEALLDGIVYLGSETRTFDVADGSAGFDLRVTAVLTGAGLLKTGAGTISLHGANTLTGETTVNEGRLYVGNDKAFGSTSGGTTVGSSGFIQLLGVDVGAEPLTLGRTTSGSVIFASADSSWAGDVVLDADAVIATGIGRTLEFSGAISGAGGITFTGPGDLTLSGSANNVYTGPTVVQDGQLRMDKASPRWAVGHGSLTVGDGLGNVESAVAREWGPFQLGSIPITVDADGLLDLNNFNDTVGNSLTLNGGGSVRTGTGTLTLGANSQITEDAQITPGSRIWGNISVGSGECTFSNAGFLQIIAHVSGSANITKTGGGYMNLMSSNSFTGTMTVDESNLSLGDPWALGSEAAGTYVNNAARLGIHDRVGNEPLTMDSSHHRAIFSSGPPGSNSWTGPVTLLRDTAIDVVTDFSLDISGQIDGPGSLVKTGEGELTLSGTGNNTFGGDTVVEEGTLLMGKSGQSIPHSMVVGGNGPGAPSAVARQLAASEIYEDLTVNASGTYDLAGYNESIRNLNLNGGADVDTGAATLTIVEDVNVDPLGIVDACSVIAGKLALSGSTVLSVPQGAASSGNPSDLLIQAVISGGGNISKTGNGELELTAANIFSGPFSVDDGGLRLDNDLGLGTAAGGTFVNGDAYLQIHGGGNTIVGEHLVLNSSNTGYGGLYSPSGANSWTGDITLQSDARITLGLAAATLDLSGSIGGSGGLTKDNLGTLILSGSAANTYTGDTYVHRGTLALNKSVPNGTILGRLYIGDGGGGTGADVVRLLRGAQIENERVTIASSGLFDLNNEAEFIGSLTGSGHVDLGSGILSAGVDGTSTTYSGLIEGAGILRKFGLGTFTLTGDNTYSGATEIHNGTLQVNGSQPSSDAKIVSTSGRLSGIGTVGDINSIGRVAPGASAGELGCRNALLESGSMFEIELNGYTPVDYDQLDVNGAVKLIDPNLSVTWGYVPAVGDEFTILENDGTDAVAGTFNGLAEGASVTAGNVTLDISYVGGTGNDVVLTATDVVALEPLALISIGSSGGNMELEWVGGVPFFVVESTSALSNDTWTAVTTSTRDFVESLPAGTSNECYRVTGGN